MGDNVNGADNPSKEESGKWLAEMIDGNMTDAVNQCMGMDKADIINMAIVKSQSGKSDKANKLDFSLT